MNNAASFNLLKFIERRPVLSGNKIMIIVALYIVIIVSYLLVQTYQFNHAAENTAQQQAMIQQSIQSLQPALQQGQGNAIIGVFAASELKNDAGFYPEFEALTHIQVTGLWLNDVLIQRNPPLVKIMGAMDTPDKLNQLLQQLSAQPAFQYAHFIGVDVEKGLLPNVPAQYQTAIAQLKLPMFYHFVIQTTALNQPGVIT
jgi:hypothetical protein